MPRSFRRPATSLAAVALILGLAVPASAAVATTTDPSANRSLSQAARVDCSADPVGSACITEALADINAARSAEGVPAMVLPGDFASMSVPAQLLNLANLERVDRGLAPILGLSAALNDDAQAGAAQDADPMPTHFYGSVATSNWAGGDESALEADFDWMYDDGPGSGNLDCTNSDPSGCWGHRHDILWPFAAPLAMGAGYATGRYGASMTELFVGGDTKTAAGQADAPVVRPSQGAAPAPAPSVPGAVGSAASATSTAPRAGAARQTKVGRLSVAAGQLTLNAACGASRGSVCKVSVTIAIPGGRSAAHHPGASYTFNIPAGRTRVVRVPLSRTLRRLLSAHQKLSVRVVIKRSGAARPVTLVSRTLTLGTRAS